MFTCSSHRLRERVRSRIHVALRRRDARVSGTRLWRLGAAGSEQSMARTLTGAVTRSSDAPTPGCDASGPAELRDQPTAPKEQSDAEAPFGLGCGGPVVRIDAARHHDRAADRGESRCLRLPRVPGSSGCLAATLGTDPAIGRFFPCPVGDQAEANSTWPVA
jgi:hypothetical protein